MESAWGKTLAGELRDRARALGWEIQRTGGRTWLLIRVGCVIIPCATLQEVGQRVVALEEKRNE